MCTDDIRSQWSKRIRQSQGLSINVINFTHVERVDPRVAESTGEDEFGRGHAGSPIKLIDVERGKGVQSKATAGACASSNRGEMHVL